MPWFDAHCHVNELDDAAEEIQNALSENVSAMACNAVDLESMKKIMELSKRFKSIRPFIGMHPSNLLNMSETELEDAWKFVQENISTAAGVGETGLDYRDAETPEQRTMQQAWFEKHLQLAKEFGKPASVHSRMARDDVLRIVEKTRAKRVLLHWFMGNESQTSKAIELGCWLSIAPGVLDQPQWKRFAERVPLHKLLLETDCPVPYNGRQSKPDWIPRIAEAVAEARKISVESLEEALEQNALDWLGV